MFLSAMFCEFLDTSCGMTKRTLWQILPSAISWLLSHKNLHMCFISRDSPAANASFAGAPLNCASGIPLLISTASCCGLVVSLRLLMLIHPGSCFFWGKIGQWTIHRATPCFYLDTFRTLLPQIQSNQWKVYRYLYIYIIYIYLKSNSKYIYLYIYILYI